MKIAFAKGDRVVEFEYCDDLEDAKKRFQWVYGYWPSDEQILNQEEE